MGTHQRLLHIWRLNSFQNRCPMFFMDLVAPRKYGDVATSADEISFFMDAKNYNNFDER